MIKLAFASLAGSVAAVAVLGGGRPAYFLAVDSLAAVALGAVASLLAGRFFATESALVRAGRWAFFAGGLSVAVNAAVTLGRAPGLSSAAPRLALAMTGLMYGALVAIAFAWAAKRRPAAVSPA